ncbi:MAG: pyridoxal phosphate-dependent aminotransferase [Deltaproteobacteria bacterium]|nr:pyridoxal phosphate-dependent aminotransferase [Deltaproteobacteria bacterium]
MEAVLTNLSITPFLVMDVMEKANALAAQGRSVIHLEVGEPDFDTPACIQATAVRAMEEGRTHYTHSLGIPELREAICEHYLKTYGVRGIDPEQVLVTAGSSPALLIAMACLAGAGDEIILTDPYYACYPNFIRILGASPRFVPTGGGDRFQLDPLKAARARNALTKALVINSPANPTGVCLDEDHLHGLCSLGLPIISDEIYHGLVYTGRQHTILEYTDNAVVINGFSKAYAMTGWRLGWAVFPKDLVRTAQKIQQNLMICAPSLAQWAGIAALTEAGPDVERMKQVFAQRRLVMLQEMAAHGLDVEVEPDGAFYVLVNMARVTRDSYRLAMDILDNTGVGVTPGIDFGPGAQRYIRFSYANSEDNIREGVSRVAEYLASR